MEYQYILFQVDKGIATITLNRPKEMNCINFEMVEEIAAAVDCCEKDEQIRAVVVTGASQMFSAGDDIKMMELAKTLSATEVAQTIDNKAYPAVIKRFMALPKPVIACVDGICFGAGGELALACDYVIASDQASFGQLYINLGLIGNTYLLPKAVGVTQSPRTHLDWQNHQCRRSAAPRYDQQSCSGGIPGRRNGEAGRPHGPGPHACLRLCQEGAPRKPEYRSRRGLQADDIGTGKADEDKRSSGRSSSLYRTEETSLYRRLK